MKNILILLVVLFISLSAFSQEANDDLFDLSLEELLNIEVTSVSKVAEKGSQSPAVVNIITHDMIRNNGYRTLYDVLTFTPGFFPITDVNDKLLGMRGVHASTSQKFLVLLNGRRITDNIWNLTLTDYNMSLHNVKHIEIIRGPGSAVYGRAALTAVINVVTFTAEEREGMELELSLGNYGYKKLGFNYGVVSENNSQLEVWGHGFSTEGQEVELGAEEDGSSQRIAGTELVDRFKFPTGSFNARYHNDDWVGQISFMSRNYQQQRAANAAFSWQDMKSNDYYGDLFGDRYLGEEHQYLVFDLTRNFKLGKVDNAVTFNYTFSRLRLRENPATFRDMTFQEGWTAEENAEYAFGRLFEFDIQSYRMGLEYFGQYQFSSKVKGLWGLESYQTTPISDKFLANYTTSIVDNKLISTPTVGGYLREKPDGTFDKLRSEWLHSAYAEMKWNVMDNVIVNAGARLDMHIKGDDFKGSGGVFPDPNADLQRAQVEKTDSEISPRLALIYQPLGNDKLTVKTLYNKSFIAPAYFYRYADPSTSYSGGPWLKSETLDNYMIALESIMGSVGGKVLYYMNINKDLLARDNTLTPARYTSLGELAMQGIELDLFYKKSIFNAFTNYSYMVGVEASTDVSTAASWIMENNTIKNFPKHYGSFGLTTTAIRNMLDLTIVGRWYGSILSPIGTGVDAGTIKELDPAMLLNFVVRYTPPCLKGLDLNVSIYNVLDTETMLGGTTKRPYSQAGRWYNFSLIKRF